MEIDEIKHRVLTLIEERPVLEEPSEYWTYFSKLCSYIYELSDESLDNIRIHTYHLTGDNYQLYEFGDPQVFMANSKLQSLTRDLPSEWVLSEPDSGIGFRIDGRLVSQDTVRYQGVIKSLYDSGILDKLQQEKAPLILEIGGGYGALARHIKAAIPKSKVIIVDIPETLFMSAVYLAKNTKKDSVYVFSNDDWDKDILTESAYDFVLLPNGATNLLSDPDIHLALNVASFQEMRQSEAEDYFGFLRDNLSGPLYSCNQSISTANRESFDVTATLSRYFATKDITRRSPMRHRALSSVKRFLRHHLFGKREVLIIDPYVELMCTPRMQPSASSCTKESNT
jgi:SAM-dependent methyltransferase